MCIHNEEDYFLCCDCCFDCGYNDCLENLYENHFKNRDQVQAYNDGIEICLLDYNKDLTLEEYINEVRK